MTDFRALCAELLVALESWSPHGGGPLECWEDREEEAGLIARARVALAQPEPVAPSDEEIDEQTATLIPWLLEKAIQAADSDQPCAAGKLTLAAQLLGERRPTIQPEPVPVAPTDEEIEEWADAASEVPLEEMDPDIHGWRRCFTAKEFSETIRAALARWGRQ